MTSNITSIGSEWGSVGSEQGRFEKELKLKGKPNSMAEVLPISD